MNILSLSFPPTAVLSLDPSLGPGAAGCYSWAVQGCTRRQARLDEEQGVNAELIKSIADLTRSKAESLRELEALKSKLRSIEV